MNIGSNIEFLKALTENNNKTWMDENKKWYEEERQKLITFTSNILVDLEKLDVNFSKINAKDCLFRINRDIRFSKDKSPYKTNFGIHLNAEGKKSPKGGFYIHIAANGESFVGGGIWMPEANNLKNIRQEIDYNWQEFQNIINDKNFVKTFDKLNDGEKLARPPKGYEADNPAIEYLKLKSFVAMKPISMQEIASDNFSTICLNTFAALNPLLVFLNKTFD